MESKKSKTLNVQDSQKLWYKDKGEGQAYNQRGEFLFLFIFKMKENVLCLNIQGKDLIE